MNKEKPEIALMSIKPRWANYIIKGNKQWEYRKQTLKSLRTATRILVYATAPECRVVGCFYVDMVVEGDLHTVWHETKWGGIPEKDYYATSRLTTGSYKRKWRARPLMQPGLTPPGKPTRNRP